MLLIAFRKFDRTTYSLGLALIALLFFATLAFGGYLELGAAFRAGLLTGLGVGGLVYAVAGFLVLKRGGRLVDERAAAISRRAAELAFWITILACAFGVILLRSARLGLEIEAEGLALLLMNLGIATWGVAAAVLSRRM